MTQAPTPWSPPTRKAPSTSTEAEVVVNLFVAPLITTQPMGGSLTVGGTLPLSVVATGNPDPTFQWKKDGADLAGETDPSLALSDVALSDAGSYTVVVTNPKGSVSSNAAEVAVTNAVPPTITAQPGDAVGEAGGSVLFTVLAAGTPPFSYQWRLDGQTIPDATTATLGLTNLNTDDVGAYSVVITNEAGSVASAAGNLTVNASGFGGAYFGSPEGETGELALWVRGTNQAVFALFLENSLQGLLEREVQIQGDGSFTFEGPSPFGTVTGQITGTTVTGSVGGLSLGFTGILSDPDGSTSAVAGAYPVSVATESGSDVIVIAGGDARAMIFVPSSDVDTGDALVGSIDGAGQFSGTTVDGVTVQLQFRTGSVSGSFDDGSGSGFLGGYRYGSVAPNLLANISMRGNVGTGDSIMIAGFVVAGLGQKPILVRAVGPTLTDFAVDGAISDPEMVVGALGGADINSNDNWEDVADQAELEAIRARVGAFQLGVGNADAALPLQLPVGSFTSRISGVGDVTGIALVEVYDTDDHEAGLASAQLANISMRGSVGTGSGIMIAGFVVQAGHGGDVGVPKQVLIRGVGPTLSGFGVQGTISDPLLQLFNSTNEIVAENDNWQQVDDVASLQSAFSKVGAFSLNDGSQDAALFDLASSRALHRPGQRGRMAMRPASRRPAPSKSIGQRSGVMALTVPSGPDAESTGVSPLSSTVTPCLAGPAEPGRIPFANRSPHSEAPHHRDHDHGDHEAEQVDRQADLDEIAESVSTRSIHIGVGLVTDGGREAGRSGDGHRDEERPRIRPRG